MSTDLRTLLKDADPGSWESLDVGALTREARVRRRQRRILQGLAGVAVVLVALLAAPNMFRQLGIQQVETTDKPPTESGQGDGLGTSRLPKAGSAPGRVVGAGGGGGQTSRGAGAPRRGVAALAAGITASPVPAGTYFYDVSGCAGGTSSCGKLKDSQITYDLPFGSHQRSTSITTAEEGGRYEAENGFDFRPDGVYYEHFVGRYTTTRPGAWNVPYVFRCPDLAVTPVRIWPSGAKPGDHFEYTVKCSSYEAEGAVFGPYSSGATSVDVLRAETLSVGGRDVATFFVHIRNLNRDGTTNTALTEAWVLPENLLRVKEHTQQNGPGEYWTMLRSMTPS